jgi:serine/threonine protein kinase
MLNAVMVSVLLILCRDMKLDNVLLAHPGSLESIKIADFGLR